MTHQVSIPSGRPFTAADLEAMPDDGNRYADLRPKHLPVAPLLVVETLSRSTASMDRTTERAHYARMGVRSYWLVDPTEPGSRTVFSLRDGEYAEIAHVVGDEEFVAVEPFPGTVVPARLLDGLRP
jgi:Uma2 family endonuclease